MIRERDWFLTASAHGCINAARSREKEQSQLAARKAFALDGEQAERNGGGRSFNEKRRSEIYKSLVTRRDGFKLLRLKGKRELSFPRLFLARRRFVRETRDKLLEREARIDRWSMHETLLSVPSPYLFGPRVFLEINGAKNQNARSAEDEERNEVAPLGWLEDFSRGILFRGSRERKRKREGKGGGVI